MSDAELQSDSIRFLERELSGAEILDCEIMASRFIEGDDDAEIEIHNLNEVNEYFRIFKDQIKLLRF